MRRTKFSRIAFLSTFALAAFMPTSASAAAAKFSITGRVNGGGQNIAVLVVGYDGTSVRVPLKANGSFKQSVPSKLVKKFMPKTKGRGATIHIVKDGLYAGPVLLAVSGTKGYTRLTPRANGTVSVGVITMKSGFARATTKSAVIDKSRSVRLKAGAPVSTMGLRQQVLMGPVHSFSALTAETKPLGADADRDGLPNFADADLNGDAIIDAAQPDSDSSFSTNPGVTALTNRAETKFGFSKILEQPWAVEVNSNVNPSVTAEQIGSYLASGLSIEMGYTVPAEELATTKVTVDCRKLSYCSVGSKSIIRGAPGEGIDGKSLVDIQNSDGIITMPRRLNENTLLLRFYPGTASASEAALTGDVFELAVFKNDVATFSEVRVATSSVVTPMAFATFNGLPVTSLARSSQTVTPTSVSAMPLTFFRPQTFVKGSTSQLLDRGGLTYDVSIWPENGSNTMYACSTSALSSLSSTLRAGTGPDSSRLFDSEQMPAANGGQLGFTLDATKCGGMNSQGTPALTSGSTWRIELQAQDADENKARIGLQIRIP